MMKTIHTAALIINMMIGLCAQAIPSLGETNQLDVNGQRQGYWIITGLMVNDKQYAADAKVEEGVYKNSLKEGLWKRFWPNGKLKAEITFAEGRPQGWYRTYYDNGICEEEGGWWNNKNTGYFRRWHPNGHPQQMFSFNDSGKRMGLQRYFYENGSTELEVEMDNGHENGIYKRYNPDGTLAEEKVFQKGQIVPGSEKIYKAVKPQLEAQPDVYTPEIGKESVATKAVPNKADSFKPNGFNTLYNSNGQLTEVGEFKSGKLRNGKSYHYNDHGLLQRIEIYRNGKYIGNGVISDEDR